jgi:hypothetical protein
LEHLKKTYNFLHAILQKMFSKYQQPDEGKLQNKF